MALVAAGCETTSVNRIGSQAEFTGTAGTGVLIFSTQKDGREQYYNRTTQLTARLYVPATGRTRDLPNEDRDMLTISSGNLNPGGDFSSEERIWHVYELVPGDYVVTEVMRQRHAGNTTTIEHVRMAGIGVALPVREGQVTYAGDFMMSSVPTEALRFAGYTPDEAQETLSRFRNLPQEMVTADLRPVPMVCASASRRFGPRPGSGTGVIPPKDQPKSN